MISIAEAATVSMDKNYCQLMWVMVQLIERTLKSDGRGYNWYSWKEEVSYAGHVRENLRLDRGEGLAQQFVEIKEQQRSTQLGMRKKDGQWLLCTNKSEVESKAFAVLIDWLEAQLGGTSFKASSSFPRCINLGDENKSLARSEILALAANLKKQTSGCWRKKILSGNVLEMPKPEYVEGSSRLELGEQGSFKNTEMSDCLILTAAALWSLFDNSLERMPNCQCTFRAASKDFIQCRGKQGR